MFSLNSILNSLKCLLLLKFSSDHNSFAKNTYFYLTFFANCHKFSKKEIKRKKINIKNTFTMTCL